MLKIVQQEPTAIMRHLGVPKFLSLQFVFILQNIAEMVLIKDIGAIRELLEFFNIDVIILITETLAQHNL